MRRSTSSITGLLTLSDNLPAKPSNPMVLTVGNVEKDNLLRKGHLPFAKSAAMLNQIPFVLVGRDHDGTAEQL